MLHLTSRFRVLLHLKYRLHGQTVIRASGTLSRTSEVVNIAVGGSGNVKLDIFHAVERATRRPSVLLHLPAGDNVLPLNGLNDDPEPPLSLLSRSFPAATVISINYRLGLPSKSSSVAGTEVARFPQPVHDATVAYEHILKEVVPSLFPVNAQGVSSWEADHTPQIALFGTHIGAALVAMLALTHPGDIHSVAIANPLVDWVILDELLRPAQPSPGSPPAKRSPPAIPTENPMAIASAAKQLIDVRTKLFASPSAYFDPFASPTLFLRAPGRDTPRTNAEALGMLDDETSFNEETEANEGWEATGGNDEYSPSPREKRLRAGDTDSLENLNIDTRALSSRSTSIDDSFVQEDLDTITEAIGADSFGPYDDDHPPKSTRSHPSSESSSSSLTLDTPTGSSIISPSKPRHQPPKRRKVLRRWPPISRIEDVMLPYFNVFVSPPSSPSSPHSASPGDSRDAGLDALLRIQGIELAELLRRACFHGREKGVGEERVILTESGGDDNHLQDRESRDAEAGEEQRTRAMVEWLRWRLESPP